MNDLAAFDRRAMLSGMAALLGVATLPVEALAAPSAAARHLPRAQYDLLSAVIDTILPTTDTPGALAADVPARIDSLLANWASPATRADVTGALERIEAAAQAAKGRGFAALSAAARAEVLRPHDAAALKPAPARPGQPKSSPFSQVVHVADPGYLKLKDMTISLYYLSEVGSRHELAYEHVPGPFEPSVKLTPASRPYLGIGPF